MKRVVSSIIGGFFAVVAIASVTQAATVVEKDGFTYKIKGDLQVQYRQDPGKEQDADIEYDDLEIKNSIYYDLGNGMKAFAGLDFGFKNAADKSDSDEGPHLEEAYVGIGYKDVSVTIGQTDSAADEFGIEMAIEHPLAEDAFDEFGATSGNDLIKLEAEFGPVTLVASNETAADSEKSDEDYEFTDVFVGGEIKGVSLGAAYQTFEDRSDGIEDLETVTIWGVSAGYDAKIVEVAADYSVADFDDADMEVSVLNLAVAAPIPGVKGTKIKGGYTLVDSDEDGFEEINGWYASVTHKFAAQKNVSVFAEIQDTDEDDSDMGYLAGLRVKF